MFKAKTLTKEQIRKILSQKPHAKAYVKHFSRIVTPFEQKKGLYEMRDEKTDVSLVGGLEEAIDFLFFVSKATEVAV